MPNFLHISDLHRSPDDPISNDELVSSLLTDLDRYILEKPPVRRPEAIIVSGDIIQGVRLGQPNHRAELRIQYEVALEFLDELTRRLVENDRSRVVLVPGNHDVDWNTALEAMSLVEEADVPPDLSQTLLRHDTVYRWAWKTRQLYRIIDPDHYARRLDVFWDFFHKFYEGVPGLLRVSRGSDANLFELHDRRVGVAAFNSCHGNDCFTYQGAISPPAIARSQLDLDDRRFYDLKIAVWHHNIEGPPQRSDYMDIELVRSMIGRGYRLGIHGHHHKTEVRPQYVDLPGRETMPVISAGSLCAGPTDLPTGFNRQYNVIEIGDDCRSARIHVREMTVGKLFGPSRLPSFGGESFIDVEWSPPANLMGHPIEVERARERQRLDEAERLLLSGNPRGAIDLLNPQREHLKAHGRKILIQALIECKEHEALLTLTEAPNSIEELTFHVKSAGELKQFERAREVLERFSSEVGLPAANRAELQNWLNAQEALAG